MNDHMLFQKAMDAGYDYKYVFGRFPESIGISHCSWGSLCRDSVIFMERDEERPFHVDNPFATAIYTRHVVKVVPLVGIYIEEGQVYVPFLNSWMSGEELERRARMKRLQSDERHGHE